MVQELAFPAFQRFFWTEVRLLSETNEPVAQAGTMSDTPSFGTFRIRITSRFSFDKSNLRLVLVLLIFIACASLPASAAPSIKFTRVPPVNPGGPVSLDSIAGRINGSHEGLKLVLYARSGRWYVQPYVDQPFTTIQPDSSWSSPTHLGTEYAALLVQEGYVPPAVFD